MRVLDIDLDFFVTPPAHWVADDGERLPEQDYEVCSADETMAYLRDRCRVSEKLSGWAIEHHDEAFACWRDALASGQLVAPFHVTHLDAHADLGLGDVGYFHLINDVMYRPVPERSAPEVVAPGLTFGNWLAFAVACRWVSDLDYVFGAGGGSDMVGFHMSDDFSGLQMKAATREQVEYALHRPEERLQGEHRDPVVPLRQIRAEDFTAEAPYDAVVLCRSPGYTPASADALYDLIRNELIRPADDR